MYKNKIKITGGILKGSYIEILDKKSQVKPTKSYIREVIFNTVLSVKNFHCLDLFSGSGILSAEAISRGADKITLIEKDKNNSIQLQIMDINNSNGSPISPHNNENKYNDIVPA